jgi:Flp pilus assembly protein TadD
MGVHPAKEGTRPVLDDAGLQALREAARLSPDNLPLRRHLAEQLLAKGYLADAEGEFRAALLLAPKDPDITAGLAESFVRQSAYGAALSSLEPLHATPRYPPPIGVIAARAQLGGGESGRAARTAAPRHRLACRTRRTFPVAGWAAAASSEATA